ncbi:MAG: hypothetical protein SFW67_37595 [Myxococcaceae bacterium]|nr:hypothetical protein [Myxococcaceae bacterium]
MDPRLQTPLFLGAFGLIFLVVGLYVLWDALNTPPDPAQTAPIVEPQGVAQQAPGTQVVVQGTIAASTPAIEADFVLLQRQTASGVRKPGSNDVRFTWDVVSTEHRPFVLEGQGRVSVTCGSAEWREPPHTTDPGTVTAGTPRLAGFKAGDVVTVLATVRSATEVDAQVLFGGDAQAFRSSIAGSAMVPRVLGGIFALVGFLTALSAVVQVLKIER